MFSTLFASYGYPAGTVPFPQEVGFNEDGTLFTTGTGDFPECRQLSWRGRPFNVECVWPRLQLRPLCWPADAARAHLRVRGGELRVLRDAGGLWPGPVWRLLSPVAHRAGGGEPRGDATDESLHTGRPPAPPRQPGRPGRRIRVFEEVQGHRSARLSERLRHDPGDRRTARTVAARLVVRCLRAVRRQRPGKVRDREPEPHAAAGADLRRGRGTRRLRRVRRVWRRLHISGLRRLHRRRRRARGRSPAVHRRGVRPRRPVRAACGSVARSLRHSVSTRRVLAGRQRGLRCGGARRRG